MKAIYRNSFNDSMFQLVEVVSEKNDNTTTIITTAGVVSVNSKRIISIPEFIEILNKEIKHETENNSYQIQNTIV